MCEVPGRRIDYFRGHGFIPADRPPKKIGYVYGEIQTKSDAEDSVQFGDYTTSSRKYNHAESVRN